eukprot:3060-Hanusia_phi.AAC.1
MQLDEGLVVVCGSKRILSHPTPPSSQRFTFLQGHNSMGLGGQTERQEGEHPVGEGAERRVGEEDVASDQGGKDDVRKGDCRDAAESGMPVGVEGAQEGRKEGGGGRREEGGGRRGGRREETEGREDGQVIREEGTT